LIDNRKSDNLATPEKNSRSGKKELSGKKKKKKKTSVSKSAIVSNTPSMIAINPENSLHNQE
jgi:hypothetical protein